MPGIDAVLRERSKMGKKFARGICLVMVSLSVIGSTGCGKDGAQKKVENNYDILDMGEIPIGMWATPPETYRTSEYFAMMKECGINFVNGFSPYENSVDAITEALNLAGEQNLKYLVSDSSVTRCIRAYESTRDEGLIEDAMKQIEAYYQQLAYAGQLLLDEPPRSMFEGLQLFIEAYEKNYPGKQWHINMFPHYAEAGAGVPYEQYVDDWMELVNPNYYSYDSYPLLEYDEDNPFARPEITDYYYNLDLLRAKTREKGIPFWSFIQTLGISGTEGVPDKRTPSREDIRWQVFTNLAFGVKGIQYFCYFTPSGGSESFTPALITTDGKKTERFDYVKELNTEISAYSSILINCHAEGVMLNHEKDEERFRLYEEKLESFGKLKSVEGDTVLVGCFTDCGTKKKSVLVTATTPRDNVSVTLNFEGGIKKVTAYINGEAVQLEVVDRKLKLDILKGDAVYIIM